SPPFMDVSTQADRPTTERLFDTAAGLFWEKGYAATTTREIAAALGIQQASLYHHMASKEDLLHKIFLASLNQFLSDVPPALGKEACPLERIKILIRTHVATLLRHQNQNMTMLTELRSLSRKHRAEVLSLRDQYEGLVRTTLENARVAGMIRGDIPV